MASELLPNYYACTGCGEVFHFAHREACYYFNFDSTPLCGQLSGADLVDIPVCPGWCKECSKVCLVEHIEPVRAFEDAYGLVRGGKPVEYPLATKFLSPQQARDALEAFLKWRMQRRHPARALCCGGTNYQLLDVVQPLLKHQECDFGVVEACYVFSGYNGPGPGVYSAANIPVYTSEGELMACLTWRVRGSEIWDVASAGYPTATEGM